MTWRGIAALAAFDVVALLVVASLVGLGVWQLERRAWKLDLIARVSARVHAQPVSAPSPANWTNITSADDEYRRVIVDGRWLSGASTLVHALTERGGGYWVLTPLLSEGGSIVIVNRGFIAPEHRESALSERLGDAMATVTGLLRMSEPGGTVLRANVPLEDRWFSRDVEAIAGKRGLSPVAPFFIDAQTISGGHQLPTPGLTVVAFSNNHLVYAMTWFVLALMGLGFSIFLNVEFYRRRSTS